MKEIGNFHNGLSAEATERENMALVAGDDVIALCSGGAFQYAVVVGVGFDDVERFLRGDGMRDVLDSLLNLT